MSDNRDCEKILLNSRDAANRLSISERTLFQLRKDGHLPAVQVGCSIRYDLDDLRKFCEQNRIGVLNERSLN